ncbi:MAG: hypothetical protein ACE14O_01390 [Candidatus Cloacimonadaceae bacterium]
MVNATFISDINNLLGIEEVNLLDILTGTKKNNTCAFRWQDSYTSGSGRRRYKPNSEGFTLKIKKNVIREYLLKNNMELYFEISLRRSVTKYKPEEFMEWFPLRKVFLVPMEDMPS